VDEYGGRMSGRRSIASRRHWQLQVRSNLPLSYQSSITALSHGRAATAVPTNMDSASATAARIDPFIDAKITRPVTVIRPRWWLCS
jgi:hypothetical protein